MIENEIENPGAQFAKIDNAIITPHSAWYSVESQEALLILSAEEILRMMKTGKPLNHVNTL